MPKLTKRKKSPRKVSVSELMGLLSTELLDSISEQTRVDFQVKKFNGILFFQLLLYGVLKNGRLSTRLLEQLYNSATFGRIAHTKGHQTRHSSIADRLNNINVKFFQALFEQLQVQLEKNYAKTSSLTAKKLLRFDSTMVAIGAGLIKEGMTVGKTARKKPAKKQLKFTMGLKGELPSDMHLYTQNTYLSEDKAIGEAIVKSRHTLNSIVVFDRGVTARQTFDALEDEQILFVTRLRPDAVDNFLETHAKVEGKETPALIFKQDIIVSLHGTRGNTRHNYRLIKAVLKKDFTPIHFLTNVMDMECEKIAEIYKRRWDIEVFFKFLKQELNIERLLSESRNGIEVIMYVRLIAAMLILIFKKKNDIEGYKIAKIIFEEELEMEIIKELVKFCGGNPELLSQLSELNNFT
jgi:hypothetical protein